jgi:MarR family transcriptional regulator, organic hydroperoxide resistance regulator
MTAIDDQALRLDAQLCFALHAAARAFDGVYRVTLRESGLTYPQYLVLLVLWEHEELTVKELGRRLRLDSGTLSPLLKRMEAAGWVERRRSARDERSVTVRPTPAGVDLRESLGRMSQRTGASTGLSLEEARRLREQIAALTDSLNAAAARLAAEEG